MPARRKSQVPPNSFWIAQAECRPAFGDEMVVPYNNIADIKPHVELSNAFYRLAELVFEKIDDREFSTKALRTLMTQNFPNFGQFYPTGIHATLHVGDPAKREALNALFVAIQKALRASHRSGIKRGKSLLIQLAKGAVTAKQFNDCAVQEDPE